MDAFTIQEHVANYLNAAEIPHLDHVYDSQPEAFGANLAEYGQGTTRCICFVNVLDDDNLRESGPAANPYISQPRAGIREFTYQVQLEVLHTTSEPDWRTAEKQLKRDVCEGISDAILNDPTLGTWKLPTPLFGSAGEGRRGIKRTYTLPDTDNASGDRWQWAALVFYLCHYEEG